MRRQRLLLARPDRGNNLDPTRTNKREECCEEAETVREKRGEQRRKQREKNGEERENDGADTYRTCPVGHLFAIDIRRKGVVHQLRHVRLLVYGHHLCPKALSQIAQQANRRLDDLVRSARVAGAALDKLGDCLQGRQDHVLLVGVFHSLLWQIEWRWLGECIRSVARWQAK